MILKGFKENSKKKRLEQLIAERVASNSNKKIDSLGIIFNLDEVDNFDEIRKIGRIAEGIVPQHKVKIIAYSSDKNAANVGFNDCYNPKDFSWNGKLKSAELQTFLNTPFDTLISYYQDQENIDMQLLTAYSKAAFKVGILQTDERLNDLIIKTEIKDLKTFKSELIKYLTILTKI